MKPDQASATARIIAAGTVLLASRPGTAHLVAPGASLLSERLLSARWQDRLLARSAGSAATRWAWRLLEAATHPGVVAHWWRRKAWIEARVRAALAAGAERVVVLGAGFDTLALRLAAEQPTLELVEVDHPATQAAKRAALAGLRLRLPRFVGLDLAVEDMPDVLFEPARPTVVVAEGLLMYLPEAALDHLCAVLRATPAPLELIFSHMRRWPDGSSGFRPRSQLVEHWLQRRGEDFAWALAPDAVVGWLRARGFELLERASAAEFGLPGSRLHGEDLVRCRVAHPGLAAERVE